MIQNLKELQSAFSNKLKTGWQLFEDPDQADFEINSDDGIFILKKRETGEVVFQSKSAEDFWLRLVQFAHRTFF